jgi:phytoene synthase
MNAETAASYRFCAKVARREAKNFYPGFLLLPPDRRRSMCALYAFLRRSDDIADLPGAADRKRETLAAWRASLSSLVAGGSVAVGWPGWPALGETVRARAIPSRYLDEVLEGVASDIDARPFATFEDLYSYCYRVASAVGLCCLHVWGYTSDGGRAEALAEAAGLALQLTNILRDVGEDARQGRVYLPADDLAEFGVGREDLAAPRTSDRVRRLLEFEASRAYDYYEKARPLVALVSPVGRPVLLAIVGIYRALLDEIARRRFDVLPGRVSVPLWKKATILTRSLAWRFASSDLRTVEVRRVP